MGDIYDTNYFYNVISNAPPVTGPLYLMISTNYPSGSLLTSNLPAGMEALGPSPVGVTLTLTNQSAQPPMDALVVTNYGTAVSGTQLLVYWAVPVTSSPQFSYRVEVFNNSNYTGTAAVTAYDIDPEARQKLLDITGVSTPYARLTVVDVMNQTNGPIEIIPATAALNAATNVTGAVSGLAYQYYESATNFNVMPNFNVLAPVYRGAVDYPDLTLRRLRQQYAFNYTGYLSVPADGIYTFTLNSCDGSILSIDGGQVVNWDGEHSPADKNGWVGLKAGLHVVNVQYFYDENNTGNGTGLSDTLTVSYAGPGISQMEVPAGAWYRAPAVGEPTVALAAPADGTSVCGSKLTLSASVTNNGATINSVEFYVGGYCWGTDTTAPFGINQFFWATPDNAIRARVFYNGTNTVDSAQNLVGTTNMNLTPWSLAAIGQHLEAVGAHVQGGACSVIGDGLNLLSQQVSGNCTVIAHVAGLASVCTSPDGQTPDPSWESGIMLRQNTNATPGRPLGYSTAQYACAFGQLGGGSYFEDYTMANAGGPYPSGNLGSYAWFEIQRVGDTFMSSVSADGVTWIAVNTNTLAGIGTVLNVGVFTYDAPSANPNVFVATLDNVSITGNILSPPSVSVTPAATTVYTGQPASFTAAPSGNPPFTYQWQYNGVNLANATNATLTETNLQPGNSGLYQVSLTTSNGQASAVGTLTVLTPPASPVQVLSPQADAYVYGNSPNSNYGTDTNLLVKTNGLAYARDTYLKFGVSALANAQSVKLQLMPISVTSSPELGFEFATNDTWTETGITWANQPAGSGLLITNMSGYTAGVPVLVDVTSQAVSKAGQDGLLSIHIYSLLPGSYEVIFGSKESLLTTNQPQLVYTLASPALTLGNPVSGAIFSAPATINLSASGFNTNGHVINYVDFYNGTNLLGQVTNAPFNYTWTNVSPGIYTVYAQAVYDGASTMSSVPAFISVVAFPSVPTGLTAAAGGWQVGLNWQEASNATSYNVKRAVTSGGPYETLANVTAPNYLDGDSSLMYSTTYYYVVTAVNGVGESANSSEVSAAPVNTPLADAYVDGGSPNSNYGTNTNLMVKLSGASYTREAYLMFDVSLLANARSVKLQLMPISVTGNPTLGFQLVSDDTWTEDGITWSNQPGGTGIVFTNLSNFTVGVPILVDVTSQAVNKASQDGLLSILAYSTISGSSTVTFGSKEQPALTNQPQLIATFPPLRPVFTGAGMASQGGFTLSGTGQAGNVYMLQMTTNLSSSMSWTSIATNMAGANSQLQFVDLKATNSFQRFYRLMAQ